MNIPDPAQRSTPLSDQSIPWAEKWCPDCDTVKPASEFWQSKLGRGGLYSRCKSCAAIRRKVQYDPEYHRKYRLERLEAKRAYDRARYADDPEKRSATVRRWYAQNPEKVKAWRKRYYTEHKDEYLARNRQREATKYAAAGFHTAEEVWEMGESQEWLCAYCEVPLFGEFHVDHMVPLSRGGSDSWENLAITCPTCNLSKNDKTTAEFYASRRST